MRKIFLAIVLSITLLSFGTKEISALEQVKDPTVSTSTAELIATESAQVATPAATITEITEKIQEKKDQDITETSGKKKTKLEALLDENPLKTITPFNFLQHMIRRSIENGLPANLVVLVILFPLITSVIAISKHIIGLESFGIYTPAVLSVAFVSTGIVSGLIMFFFVLITSVIFKKFVKHLKLQYLPRTAMLLWGVSTAVLLLLITTSMFSLTQFLSINIFPLLIVMLLTENFMETQLASNQSTAFRLTIETVAVAIFCSLLISAEFIQNAVMLNPELTILAVAILNIVVGKYSGLRLLEYIRFRSIIEN